MPSSSTPAGRLLASKYSFWFILALPAVLLVAQRFLSRVPFDPFDTSGKISCWLLIVTLMITPLMYLVGPLPWLKARRRYLGVASFLYGLFHTALWLKSNSLPEIAMSFFEMEAASGWLALALMLLPAMTSNDAAVRRFGPVWKTIQRWAYPAAALALLHWVVATDYALAPWVYSAPLIALSVWRVIRYQRRMGRI